MEVNVSQYPQLREEQRIEARQRARENVIASMGHKPIREQFDDYTVSKYPRWFTLPMMVMLFIIGIAAASISMFRIFYAGRDYFLETIPDKNMAFVVGVATFLAAELLVIVSTILSRVYLEGKTQIVVLVPILIGLMVAFVGNWHIARPDSLWGWLDTLFPPLAVLSVAFFFELALMPEIERRQANEVAYKAAMDQYRRSIEFPEKHEGWRNAYGWALWDVWRKGKRREVLIDISDQERQAIVLREMAADRFFSEKIAEISEIQRKPTENNNHAVRRVVEYLDEDPARFQLSGAEISEILQVSEPSVSRGKKKFSENGYHHE